MCEKYSEYAAAPQFVISEISSSCRFHKKPGETYPWPALVKDFGCLELFEIFYPLYLAALYQAELPPSLMRVQCPSAQNSVTVALQTYTPKSLARRGLNAVKQTLRPLRPSDFMLVDAGYKVIQVEGHCPHGYGVGDEIRFAYTGSACPAWVYSMLAKKSLAPGAACYRCPSDVNLVSFCHEHE